MKKDTKKFVEVCRKNGFFWLANKCENYATGKEIQTSQKEKVRLLENRIDNLNNQLNKVKRYEQ